MSTKFKRFLILTLTAVLLLSAVGMVGFAEEEITPEEPVCYDHGDVNQDGIINHRDAIYALYYSLFGDLYPVNQDCDFNGDGKSNHADAIYLLYASLLDHPDYQLEGAIHNYFAPVWKWEETEAGMTASVSVSCGCGAPHDDIAAQVSSESKEPTCVENGYVKYTASAQFEGQTYTAEKVVEIPSDKAGHTVGTPTCTEGAKCENYAVCGFELAPLGHSYELISATAATCQTPGLEQWKCSTCGEEKTVTLSGDAVPCTFVLTASEDVQVDASKCQWAKNNTYTCSVCGETKLVEQEAPYYVHSYTATLTAEATCVSEGVKTFTCTCGDSYTEAVPVNPDAHTWDAGVVGDGVTVYTCQGCGTTKDVVTLAEDGSVSKEAMAAADEVKLAEDTAVSLDDATVEELKGDVVISVEKADVSGLLTQEQKEQVGDNTVYDFNMVYAETGEAVSEFAGEVTVSLPYTLGEGEDIDSIDVWYIGDDGQLQQMKGSYANGFVTFTTSHFSYYTVTRLTPAQRCARYGHILEDISKQATCTEDGYTMSICQRCGEIPSRETVPAIGHRYNEPDVKAHCVEEVSFQKTCENCGHTVKGSLPAIGHNMQLSEELSEDATCTAPGKIVSVCANGCGYQTVEETAQLEHKFEHSEKKPNCANNGHKKKKCIYCGMEEVLEEIGPTGHNYTAENAVWEWSEDYSSAQVTLVCAYSEKHTKTLKTVVTVKTENASCQNGGTITYTASGSFNKYVYTDVKVVELEKLEHKPAGVWYNNAAEHYQKCEYCDTVMETGTHSWNDGTVTQKPTCVDEGKLVYACIICGYEKESAIPATGVHSFVNGECEHCGYKDGTCDHIRTYETAVDLSGYDICGGTIIKDACACGQYGYINYTLNCQNMTHEELRETDSNGIQVNKYVNKCADCGLTIEESHYWQMESDRCVGEQLSHIRILVGDQEVCSLVARLDEAPSEHPSASLRETISLKEFGLCNESVSIYTCPCGQREYGVETSFCNWRYEDEQSTGEEQVYTCMDCGAVRRISYRAEQAEGSCQVQETKTQSYWVNGEKVYSFANSYAWFNHSYLVADYELDGDSCENGLYLKEICALCDYERERYVKYHYEANQEVIDLSNVDICFDALVKTTCLCQEKVQNCYLAGENQCQWDTRYFDDGRVEGICLKCGATFEAQETYHQQPDSCWVDVVRDSTWYTKDGTLVGSGSRNWQQDNHDMRTEFEMAGTSCLDGVTVHRYCVNCDWEHTMQVNDHFTERVEYYDGADLGMCPGEIAVYKCACGQECGFNWGGCDWQWIDGGPEYESFLCPECGVKRTNTFENLGQIDQCHSRRRETVTYEKDGEVLLTIEVERFNDEHVQTFTLTLLDDETTCSNNRIQADWVCSVCGDTGTWNIWTGENEHPCYPIARETIEIPGLCGIHEVTTYGCACGEEMWQEATPPIMYCMYTESYYDETVNARVSVCENCGIGVYETWEVIREDEDSCDAKEIYGFHYRKDGVELGLVQQIRNVESHDVICTFEMLGETCDDGFLVFSTCRRCGDSWSQGIQYGCSNWVTAIYDVYENEKICGSTISIYQYGCPCNPKDYTEVRYGQYHEFQGNEDGSSTCKNCHLTWHDQSWGEMVPKECAWVRHIQHKWLLDGQVVAEFNDEGRRKDHARSLYTFELAGNSCEDGYYLTTCCAYCGEILGEKEWRTDGHNMWDVECYFLDDYGMCGGGVEFRSCACGETCYYSYGWGGEEVYCNWEETGVVDPEDGIEAYCQGCGTYRYIKDEDIINPGNCSIETPFSAKYVRDDKVLLEISGLGRYPSHEYVTSVALVTPGTSCEDGVIRVNTCSNCGLTEEHTVYYHAQASEVIDLNELGACGGTVEMSVCACEQFKQMYDRYSCSMELVESWDNRENYGPGQTYQKYACSQCGLIRERIVDRAPKDENCREYDTETKRYFFNGQLLAEMSKVFGYGISHNDKIETTLLNPEGTCEDGVSVHRLCLDCGYESQQEIYYHERFSVHALDLDKAGFCEGFVEEFACACGQQHVNTEHYTCDWEAVSSPENSTRYVCRTCGLIKEYSAEDVATGNPCEFRRMNAVSFSYKDSDLGTYREYSDPFFRHNSRKINLTLVNPNGSCEEGVTWTEKCDDCGIEIPQSVYHHMTFLRETIDVGAAGGCEGTLEYSACLCGREGGVNTENSSCEFWYVDGHSGTLEDGTYRTVERYVCHKCGLAWNITRDDKRQEPYCQILRTYLYTFQLNDQVLGSFAREGVVNDHSYAIVNATLMDPNGTCDDGVRATYACKYCGTSYETEYWYHEEYEQSRTDLKEKGACGGTLSWRGCACGAYGAYSHNDVSCQFETVESWDETEENGERNRYVKRICRKCGLIQEDSNTIALIGNECEFRATFVFAYTFPDGTSESHQTGYTYVDHQFKNIKWELMDPNGNCDNGVRVTVECTRCGLGHEQDHWGHSTFLKKRVELKDLGACGGYVETWECACGQNSNLMYEMPCSFSHVDSWTVPGEDGINRNFSKYQCYSCGLYYEAMDEKLPTADPCLFEYHHLTSYYMGTELIASDENSYHSTNHSYDPMVYTLLPGATTCEDGIKGTQTCRNCGHVSENMGGKYHYGNLVEAIDLKQYGAVCDTWLNRLVCPCGQREFFELDRSSDNSCDLDVEYPYIWIEDAVTGWQQSTQGDRYYGYDCYVYTCAVTDPEQCGLKLRMGTYYLPEGDCRVTQYQTWQLGYDPETGTCQREITIATGNTMTYHRYESVDIGEDLADGTHITGNKYTCLDCGSYYTDKYWYDSNWDNTKHEIHCVNLLDNGENKESIVTTECTYVFQGRRYVTLERNEYVDKSGATTWNQREYTFGYPDACTRTTTSTNSAGNYDQWTEEWHQENSQYEHGKDSTCTQFGEYGYHYTCDVCDWERSYTYQSYPYGHEWEWNEEKQMYVCYRCALENTNGADGVIVVEDLTEEYGNGTDYVVGYHNRENLKTLLFASVILDDVAADAENQLDLMDIVFTYHEDDYVAVSCNKEEVLTAAKAAMAEIGYTGSFAIRISFVPMHYQDTLDYAITFDSQIME